MELAAAAAAEVDAQAQAVPRETAAQVVYMAAAGEVVALPQPADLRLPALVLPVAVD
jgi:hypothetical protein